jgi:hypothetical protein
MHRIHVEREFEGLIIEARGKTSGLRICGTHMRRSKYAHLPARRREFEPYGGPCHGFESSRR